MALKIVSGSLQTGHSKEHTFPNKVISAGVALQGFLIGYDEALLEARETGNLEGTDHHVKHVKASVVITSMSGENVTVKAEASIVDASGNSGGGTIDYLLIVETE